MSDNLHSAAEKGNIAKMQQLLAAGANIEEKDGNDRTPLHIAARDGQAEAARLLLGKGADVDAPTEVRARPCRARVVGARVAAAAARRARREARRAVGGRGLAAGGGRVAADRRRGVRAAGELTRVLVPVARSMMPPRCTSPQGWGVSARCGRS